MSFESQGAAALDYQPCRYGASKLQFRGPQAGLDGPYIACIGGTETYGRCVADPFPALLSDKRGRECVNLGLPNAGLDAFSGDIEILRLAIGAQVRVLQVLGAINQSNRFYRVHPRRNDRFLSPSTRLQAIFPEVDFTEFTFNRHLLGKLLSLSPQRFAEVRAELQAAWVGRMRSMLRLLGAPTVLLWLRVDSGDPLGPDPLMVSEGMIDAIRDEVSGVVEMHLKAAGASGGLEGMIFSPLEEPAALRLIGPSAHARIARTLEDRISAVV